MRLFCGYLSNTYPVHLSLTTTTRLVYYCITVLYSSYLTRTFLLKCQAWTRELPQARRIFLSLVFHTYLQYQTLYNTRVCVRLILQLSTKHIYQPTIFTMLIQLTVGKVDAGVAVLLTEDKRLVRTLLQFPAPPYHTQFPSGQTTSCVLASTN